MNKFLVKEEASEQQVARMLDSFGSISEAGSVAHVLALDALDAVKDVAKTRYVQGGPSGRGLAYVEINFKVWCQDKLLKTKRNSKFEVNKS